MQNSSEESQELLFTVISVLIKSVLRAHSPDAARTQYLTHTAQYSCTFTLSVNTYSQLRRYTTSSVNTRKTALQLNACLTGHCCLSRMFNSVAVTLLEAYGTLGCSITF